MEVEKNLEENSVRLKKFELEQIDFNTQKKILKETILEKEENIQMLTNEVEAWMSDLYKERVALYNAEQNVSILESKLQSIKKDNDKKYF